MEVSWEGPEKAVVFLIGPWLLALRVSALAPSSQPAEEDKAGEARGVWKTGWAAVERMLVCLAYLYVTLPVPGT